ncbi:hypothetical protein [endosymbiont GvMRE of Glomus versiforme]|uniref:hypothetical protein n=1 Tax=endosymbiont GvMRE of Glomus versiforme TaxID=2039283 RepID=UPI000EE7420C|nr:hypothetical protein [endosymbiont GvMRE of Glomus versiforme]RHZ37266.1 hypothetical protein GvMRE_I1g103 [endosymbiont GvMRE of Glomus versiforme]
MSEEIKKCDNCNYQFPDWSVYYTVDEKSLCENCYKARVKKEENIRKKWREYKNDDFNCIICNASKYKEAKEKLLTEAEGWEIKKKRQLQEDLKKLNEIISDIGEMKCHIKQVGDVHNEYAPTGLGIISYSPDEICRNCGVTVKKNDYGDVRPIEHKKNCQISNQSQPSNQTKSNKSTTNSTTQERERESKTNYFPWILGSIAIITLIATLIWYFTRKKE